MKTKILPFLLAVIMVIGFMPVETWAASTPDSNIFDISEGNITISAGTDADTVSVTYGASNVKDNIPAAANITIIGTTTGASVSVTNVKTNITLDNVSIQNSTTNKSSLSLASGATVALNLTGSNTLKSGTNAAGLQVPSGASIVIDGAGSLSATGGQSAAGIGGGKTSSGGTITINGGTITATSGSTGGAGIGGGYQGSGGTITINGGAVTATGGANGAGIGGGVFVSGAGGDAGTIVISGGTVNATGGSMAAGIGGGMKGSGGMIDIRGGNVTATSGASATGIGEGGSTGGTAGTIRISDAATVKASSYLNVAAIHTASGALESGSTASILAVTYSAIKTVTAGYAPVTAVYDKNSSSLYTSLTPTVGYQSLAFSVPVGTYYIKTAGVLQQHDSGNTMFTVSTAGITAFGSVSNAAQAYTMTAIDDQTMTVLPYDYADGSQQSKTVPIKNSGTGDLKNLAVTLSGGDTTAFTVTSPLSTTLDASTTSTAFTVTAKDGLPTGTYSATVKISADSMIPALTFTVTQVVKPAPTYIIASIGNQNLSALTPGYEAGTQQIKTVTIDKTGTEDLNNLMVALSGTNKSAFVITQPIITKLDTSNTGTTFTIRARDALAAGTYQATVTITADNMSPAAFTVTQAVGTALSSDANLSDLTLSAGTLTPEFVPATIAYSVSVGSSISAVTITPVAEDGNATLKVNGQDVVSGQVSQTISLDMGSNSITVLVTAQDATAKTYTITVTRASSGGNSSSHRSSTSSNSVSAFNAVISVGTDSINVPVSVDSTNGVTTAKLTDAILSSAFRKVEIDSDGRKSAGIEMPQIEGTSAYVLQLPAAVLSSTYSDRTIKLESEAGTVTLPDNMLTGSEEEETATVGISIRNAYKSGLSQEVQNMLGSRPVVELSLIEGDKTIPWNNPNAHVTVSIPYAPTAEELNDPEHITVWYIDGSGEIVSVPSGKYDPATGTVTFTATHFSCYGVGYVNKTFTDLGSAAWAKKQIEVMASKGILSGTGTNTYSPKANITRADYMVMLVRTLGLTADFEENFADIEPSAYYYDAVGIAKKLAIADGSGNNCFNPNQSISRQDMMVLTARAMEKCKELKATSDTDLLKEFSDRGAIAGYAVESLSTLVKEGLAAGTGNRLNPGKLANRAEAAVFLYNIYNK